MSKIKEKPKRIIHVVNGEVFGGIEAVMLNYYNALDKKKYQFDFIFHSKEEKFFFKEIQNQGGKIFYCPPLGKNPIVYVKTLSKIFDKKNHYDIVHIHTGFQTGFVALIAMIKGIKIRICHAHNVEIENQGYEKIFFLWKLMIKIFCNVNFACSYKSGEKWYGNNKFIFIPNALDITKFDIKREEENTGENIGKNRFVLGHAGRFVPVKNHKFLIELMKIMKSKGIEDICLILAGEGPLLEDIRKATLEMKLEDRIYFLGNVEQMDKFWGKCNMMLLPSHNEGFSNVFLEAQACGVYCLLNSKLDAIDNMGFKEYEKCSLENTDEWVERILAYKKRNINKKQKGINYLKNSKFDIKIAVKELENLYQKYTDGLKL
ncbi:MAG: glycosyltransferase [Cellulosilyticaceae bacterium]